MSKKTSHRTNSDAKSFNLREFVHKEFARQTGLTKFHLDNTTVPLNIMFSGTILLPLVVLTANALHHSTSFKHAVKLSKVISKPDNELPFYVRVKEELADSEINIPLNEYKDVLAAAIFCLRPIISTERGLKPFSDEIKEVIESNQKLSSMEFYEDWVTSLYSCKHSLSGNN